MASATSDTGKNGAVKLTLKTLKEDADRTKLALHLLSSRVSRSEKISRQAREDVSMLEPTEVADYLRRAKVDAKEIHDKYKIMVFKSTVATELQFLARLQKKHHHMVGALSAAIIKAFDQPDEWWRMRAEYTLEEWMKELAPMIAAVNRSTLK